MSRVIKLAALAFVGIVILGACTPGLGGKEVTEADNGKTVEVAKGSDLKVKLVSNPTTGYSWQVKDVNASILKQAGDPAFKSENEGLVGAGGWETFTFNAASAGQTTLKMEYRRPWETEEPATETFSITVVVK